MISGFSLLCAVAQFHRHHRGACAEQVHQDGVRIELTLARRSKHRGEDLLRVGAPGRAVAATDLARDHGGTQRLLSAPVGGIDRRGIEQKREQRGPLDREMGREAPHVCGSAGMIEKRIQTGKQLAARHGEAMRRDPIGEMAVANGERVLQDLLDGRDEARARVIRVEEPTAP